jgi:uncharacterized membrane protein
MTKFSKKEAINYGWEEMKKNFWFFATLLLISGIVSAISRRLNWNDSHQSASLVIIIFIFWLAFFVLARIIEMGQIRITLDIFDNRKPELKNLLTGLNNLPNYIISLILYGAIVMVGTILLIIPGIIWAIKYEFATFLVIDKKMDPVDALKKSSEITKGNRWNLFLFDLVCAGVIALGALFFVVGLFAAIPTVMMATVFIYRKLLAQSESPKPQIVEPNKV